MTVAEVLEVVDPGILTTIQDAGRPGLGALGVPRAGACDPTSLAIANLLLGNRPDDPALECTLSGPELLVLRDGVVGLAGADLGAVTLPSGRRLATGAAHAVAAGERLSVRGGGVGGEAGAEAGCRAYLAVPGGFEVSRVLGSASTSLVGGFGGLDGRPLRAGDRLRAATATSVDHRLARNRWPIGLALPGSGGTVAVLPGPAATGERGRAALDLLTGTTWRVAAASDRRGLRLEGPVVELDVPADGPSHGVPTGTIQVTPSGQPLVLLPDAGPTGGYPVLAVVATASLSIVGQARPGGTVRFRLVAPDVARAEERARRDTLAAGGARLAATDPWDDLPDHAGA
ncbi:MAG TPA: biotin-dependent carboxyltransferase family protein [Candidatus Limnocylindrales bacterium]|nr:biotin-dependent carboxyltransferase family protein [Candidatus Limnocylindrales bacterium]